VGKRIVIVGAGPGLGAGVARAFGRRGFQVSTIARRPKGIACADEHLADIREPGALTAALAAIGAVDVLVFSPSPSGSITNAITTTVGSAAEQLDLHVLGAIAAVRAVLPAMLERGSGTILLTTGVSSTVPAPFLANVGLAMAALRNWAHTLHAELRPRGVHAATVTIASGVVPGDPVADPDVIGERYHALHQDPDEVEAVIGDMDAFRALVAAASGGSAGP
jgi:short-subunit dehydrogenase